MPPNDLQSIGKVVESLQAEFPDVSISSLRFLEREGLLEPTRTPGGHRLYSRADVARIRQIKRWQAQRLSLSEIRSRIEAGRRLPAWSELAHAYCVALIAGDTRQAAADIRRAQAAGASFTDLAEYVLQPALYEIGRLWAAGEVTVAQEHLATAATHDLLTELAAAADRLPSIGRHAVTACVPGERHELGLKMIALALELVGWDVDYLGADAPADTILDFVQRRRPDILLLSAASTEGHAAALEILHGIAAMPETARPRVQIGGQSFQPDGDYSHFGADFLNGHLSDVLATLGPAFGAATPNPVDRPEQLGA